MAIPATIPAFADGALALARDIHADAERHAAADCHAARNGKANPDRAEAAQHLIDARHPWAGTVVSRLRRVQLTLGPVA